VRRGTKFEPLSRELWTSREDELSARFGSTFCLSGNEHRLLEYGTSHGNGEVVKIPYGMGNRSSRNIANFLFSWFSIKIVIFTQFRLDTFAKGFRTNWDIFSLRNTSILLSLRRVIC